MNFRNNLTINFLIYFALFANVELSWADCSNYTPIPQNQQKTISSGLVERITVDYYQYGSGYCNPGITVYFSSVLINGTSNTCVSSPTISYANSDLNCATITNNILKLVQTSHLLGKKVSATFQSLPLSSGSSGYFGLRGVTISD